MPPSNGSSPTSSGRLLRRLIRPGPHVVMAGYCSSGKSTVGRLVADALQRSFVDIDQHVERNLLTPVRDIIRSKGTPFFRQAERHVLRQLDGTPSVIATGSGTITNVETLLLVLRLGTLVWIDVDEATILQRQQQRAQAPGPSHWPDLEPGQTPPPERVRDEMRRRGRYYALADLRVPGAQAPEAVCAELLRQRERHGT